VPGCSSVSSATKLQLLMSVRNIDLAPITFIKVGRRVESWAEVGLPFFLSYIHNNPKGGIISWNELSSGGEGRCKFSTTSEGTTERQRETDRETERERERATDIFVA
jgi:hypothetical protein